MGHLHKLLLISKLWFAFPDFGTSFKMLMINFHGPWLLDPGVPWENRKAERGDHNLDFSTQQHWMWRFAVLYVSYNGNFLNITIKLTL